MEDNIYSCLSCNITYKSKSGLWKHIKKTHNNEKTKKYVCEYCNKSLSRSDHLKNHLKICKEKNKKDEIKELKELLVKIESKLDNASLTTTNIKNSNNTNNNNTNSNNTNINNGNIINNNIVINNIGEEKLFDLSEDEIIELLNHNIKNIIYYLEFINFNKKYPQNHSYCMTAYESSYISVYNPKTKSIDKSNKRIIFDDLLDYSIKNISALYNSNKKLFSQERRKLIEENIQNLKGYQSLSFRTIVKKELFKQINLLSYNNRELILNTWSQIQKDKQDKLLNAKESDDNNSDYDDIFIIEKYDNESSSSSDDETTDSIQKLDIIEYYNKHK